MKDQLLYAEGVEFVHFYIGKHLLIPENCSTEQRRVLSLSTERVPERVAGSFSLGDAILSLPVCTTNRWLLLHIALQGRNLRISLQPHAHTAAALPQHSGTFSACLLHRSLTGQMLLRELLPTQLTQTELLQQLAVRELLHIPRSGCWFFCVNGQIFLCCTLLMGGQLLVMYLPLSQQALLPCFTPRELEMLQLAACGQPYRSIAHHLHVTEGTVKRTIFNARQRTYTAKQQEIKKK